MNDEEPTTENTEQPTFQPVLYKFTNHAVSPDLDDILAMFYKGVYANTVGIMQAMNIDSGEEELLLVGIVLDANNKPDCYPIAKCLRSEDVMRYLAPNGKGGFYDPLDPTELADAKDNMKTLDDALSTAEPVEATP